MWGLIFVESPKRPSKLIFVVLNFVTATSPGAWHCCINDDVIDTRNNMGREGVASNDAKKLPSNYAFLSPRC